MQCREETPAGLAEFNYYTSYLSFFLMAAGQVQAVRW